MITAKETSDDNTTDRAEIIRVIQLYLGILGKDAAIGVIYWSLYNAMSMEVNEIEKEKL